MNDIESVGLLSKLHLQPATNGKGSQLRPSYTRDGQLEFAFYPTSRFKKYSHKFTRPTRWKYKKSVKEKKKK